VTIALIDGDIVAYRASVGMQKDHNWGDGVVSSEVDPREAASAALQTIEAWMRLARCNDALVAFTGRNNFRKLILPTYKANRAGKVKPVAYRHTVEAVEARFETRTVDWLEADDLLGILATRDAYSDAIVVSLDKDLRTIPGRHLNPLKETKPVARSVWAADAQWMMQTLTGDTSDGYVGIPRVGLVKAERFLGGDVRTVAAMKLTAADLWPRVVAAYAKHKLSEKDALVQARVSRILRDSDYDRNTKEVILWHPTAPERLSLNTAA
jgi:DNA polymerase-1